MLRINETDLKLFLKTNYRTTVTEVEKLQNRASSIIVFCQTEEFGCVVVKVSHWYLGFARDSLLALETVYGIAENLHKNGVNVQTALRSIDGKYATLFCGVPLIVLNYFKGSHFSGRREEWVSAAAALSLFHKVGSGVLARDPLMQMKIRKFVPVEKSYEESRELYLYGGFRERLADSMHRCDRLFVCTGVRKALPLIDESIAYIDRSLVASKKLSEGILHNDFNHSNGLFSENAAFIAFLDADQLGIGPFIFDIGNTLASFASIILKTNPRLDLQDNVKRFLQKYHEVVSLPQEEYGFIVAAALRWDIMRILRSMRRHHFEDDRLPELLKKIPTRLLPRVRNVPRWFRFLNEGWIKEIF